MCFIDVRNLILLDGNVFFDQSFFQCGIQFLDGLNDVMISVMNWLYNVYFNYIDFELDRDEVWYFYYGKLLFERLKLLKRDFDFGDVFWNFVEYFCLE